MNYPVHILLVEDNDGDAYLTMEAIKDGNLNVKQSRVKDGQEAIDFLQKTGSFSNSERPDLVLLDINLPKVDGLEVLSFIKNSDDFRLIPVVMLTTSSAESDIYKSYSGHANCYIVKPININKFMEVVKLVEDFWLNVVTLHAKK
jgi:two-component system, chemotaxis family, response regulator Rcp1